MKRAAGQKRKAQYEDDAPIKKARRIEDSIQAMGQYDDDDNFMDSDDQDQEVDNFNNEDMRSDEDGNDYESNGDEDEGDQFDDDEMPELSDIQNGRSTLFASNRLLNICNIDDSTSHGKKKNRKKKKDPLTKLPSSDEIRLLKETESMFKSNLFRMEMEELLNACRPSESEAVKQALKGIKSMLEKLPDKNVRLRYLLHNILTMVRLKLLATKRSSLVCK